MRRVHRQLVRYGSSIVTKRKEQIAVCPPLMDHPKYGPHSSRETKYQRAPKVIPTEPLRIPRIPEKE